MALPSQPAWFGLVWLGFDNEETERTTSSSVVKDLLEQLQSLNRRLLDIKTTFPKINLNQTSRNCQNLAKPSQTRLVD